MLDNDSDTHKYTWDLITRWYHNFSGALDKPLMKLGHVLGITSYRWNYLSTRQSQIIYASNRSTSASP